MPTKGATTVPIETIRRPVQLLAKGPIFIKIIGPEVVILDDHGLLVRIHSAKAISFDWNGDEEIYGDLTPDITH